MTPEQAVIETLEAWEASPTGENGEQLRLAVARQTGLTRASWFQVQTCALRLKIAAAESALSAERQRVGRLRCAVEAYLEIHKSPGEDEALEQVRAASKGDA